MRTTRRRWWLGGALALAGCGSSITIGEARRDDAAVAPADVPAPGVDVSVALDLGVGVDVGSPAVDASVPRDLGSEGCEGASPPVGTACSVGVGGCQRVGAYACRADLGITVCGVGPGAPAPETCNGLDDDCNGMVDELAPRGCFTGPAGAAGVGVCRAGTQACLMGAWGPCASEVVPSVETCNGLDDDCDGALDDGVTQQCGDLSWSTPGRYTRAPSMTPTPATRMYIDACAVEGHRTYLAGADDGMATEALPFAFQAFGRPATAVTFTANGVVGFAAGNWSFNNTTLPTARATSSVFAFWDDLAMRDGVCTATVGRAPSRVFVIEWHDARFFPATNESHLSFEVVLEEGSHTVEVLYGRLEGDPERTLGSGATVGIQGDESAASTDLVSFNMARPMLSGSGLRWTPAPVDMRGTCRAGRQVCAAGAWGACAGEVGPAMERCGNGLDEDCDGTADDGCP
jgi:hypothetical protein